MGNMFYNMIIFEIPHNTYIIHALKIWIFAFLLKRYVLWYDLHSISVPEKFADTTWALV